MKRGTVELTLYSNGSRIAPMRREGLFRKQREESVRQRRREKVNNVFMAIMLAISFAVLIYWLFLKVSH
jgi:hypothetical protein